MHSGCVPQRLRCFLRRQRFGGIHSCIERHMTDTFGALRRRIEPESINDRAHDWWRQLPATHRPANLASRFPHVMNAMAVCWDDCLHCERYLSSLLVEQKRQLRQGFPPEVGQELMRLHSLHASKTDHCKRDTDR